MSRFLASRPARTDPYVPGEQPRDRRYIKLNTNESPYPPPPSVIAAAGAAAGEVSLYPDPEYRDLRAAVAPVLGTTPDRLMMTNGSDEILYDAFAAFCDGDRPAVFADVTYGFYRVFAAGLGIPFREIPLREDFTLDVEAFAGARGMAVIANPNAPTGIALSRAQVERIVRSDPDRVVVVDEAYAAFGAESSVPLTEVYDNLLVTGTFSKSRSMAGARLGYGIGDPSLIADLQRIRYAVNPYNVSRMADAMGRAAAGEEAYFRDCCRKIAGTREWTREQLEEMGFETTPSSANFLFVRSPDIAGETLYRRLKEKGILIRHFTGPRLDDWNRITVGTPRQMEILLNRIREIITEDMK